MNIMERARICLWHLAFAGALVVAGSCSGIELKPLSVRVLEDTVSEKTSAPNRSVSENPGPGDWWMFGREPSHNRRSPFLASQYMAVQYSHSYTTGWVDSSPAIADDGTVYVGTSAGASGYGYLLAYTEDLQLKWAFETAGSVTSSPAIEADGTVYFGSGDSYVYAVNPNGTEKWRYPTGDAIAYSSPAVAPDGTIYIGSNDGYLYAINPNGTLRWRYKYSMGGAIESSPAIALDGTIYVGARGSQPGTGYLYALSPGGAVQWVYGPPDVNADVKSSPAVGSDGSIYVGDYGGVLHAINPDGSNKWRYPNEGPVQGYYDHASPAIGADGTIYIQRNGPPEGGSGFGDLLAVNPDGTLRWKKDILPNSDSSPAIDNNGVVYIGSNDLYFWPYSYLYAFDGATGVEKSKLLMPLWVYSSPAIGENGLLYVGCRDGKLYAIGNKRQDWWMFGHDPLHTRRSPFVGPQTPTLAWKAEDPELYVISSPALAFRTFDDVFQRGAVYFGSHDSNVCGYNTDDHTLIGSYYAQAEVISSPAIAEDGSFYIGDSSGKLRKFTHSVGLIWSFVTQDRVYSSPVIDGWGDIYFGSYDYYFYKVTSNGDQLWRYKTGGAIYSSPALSREGNEDFLYFGSKDNKLYKMRYIGLPLWTYTTGGDVESSPAVDIERGVVYFGSDDRYVYAVNFNGSLRWRYQTGDWVHSSPGIGSDGAIYIGSNDHYIYAFNPDGTLNWSYSTQSSVRSSPAIGADGTVYIGSDDGRVYALNADGTLKWSYDTGFAVVSTPAIDNEGALYVGNNNGFLYVFKDP